MWTISLYFVFNSVLIISFRRPRQTQSVEIAIPPSQGSSISSSRFSHRTSTTTSSTWAMRYWTVPWRRLPKKQSPRKLFQRRVPFKRTGKRAVQAKKEYLLLWHMTATILMLTMESAKKWRVFWSECLKGAFLAFLVRLIVSFAFVQVSQSDAP